MKKINFFLIVFLTINCLLYAQKPGGTSLEVELWLKADAINQSNGTNVNSWIDQSGKNRTHIQSGTNSVPVFDKINLMNFQPSLRFAPGVANRKLIYPTHFVEATKSYFIFYVSRVETNSTTRGVVYAFNATRHSDNGWRYGNPSISTAGTGSTYSIESNADPKRMAGINTSIRTNSNSIADQLYYNGNLFGTMTNATRIMNTGIGASIIGNSNTGNEYPFYGNVQEIIVLSSTVGNSINPAELQKVLSYLSIKYGIGLSSTQENYVNSNNEVIWDGSTNNSYQNDRFGIGRDDNSGLYQKQSTSYDKSFATIFLGDLATINNDNTSTIDNNNFLIFGSNGLNGTENFEYKQGTSFNENTILSSDVNKRQRIIFKAQTYGKTSFNINIKSNIRATHLLVSTNENFSPTTTRVYTLNSDNIAQNIRIDNGNYITFAHYLTAPGGVVDGLRVWLNASEENLDLTGDKIDVWRDLSNFGNDYSHSAVTGSGTKPSIVRCDPKMNFNTSIRFETNDALAISSGPMSVNAPDNFTSFVMYNSFSNTSTTGVYTHAFGNTNLNGGAGDQKPAMGFTPRRANGRLYAAGSGNDIDGSGVEGYSLGSTALEMIHTRKASATGGRYVKFDFGGFATELNTPGTSTFGNNFLMASGGIIGGGFYNPRRFDGIISEIFFYERELTNIEQDKIRSFLAMKYALTLDEDRTNPTKNYDYILSDGITKVWPGNSTPTSNYHNRVTGLVRDDNQGLNIQRSKSTEVNSSITLLTKGTETCGISGETFDNLNALFIGDNNGSTTPSDLRGNEDICGEIDYSLTGPSSRIWLAQNTNANNTLPVSSKTITLKAGGDDFPFSGSGYEVYLLVADSDSKLKNNQWDQIVPMTYIDGEHVANYTFTDQYTYFTFGAKSAVGDCETCNFSGTKSLDFIRTNWPTRGDKGPKTFNLGDDFNVNVQYIDDNNLSSTNYPRTSSLKSLRNRRSGTDAVTTKINFTNDEGTTISSAASFEIFNIDREAYRLNNVQVIGYCNGVEVYPKLTYTYPREERSRYTIGIAGKANAKARGVRYNGNSGYTNKRGRMFVEFENTVQEIQIINTVTHSSTSSGTMHLGIGPIEFYCPAPLPEPNEDGIIFTKQGTTEVLLCDEVDYSFRFVNTNCDTKITDLTDELPEGMVWANESVSTELEIDGDITGYGTRTLKLNNLKIPGGGSLYTVRAIAIFDDSATAGDYNNQAKLSYENSSGITTEISSIDRLTGESTTITSAVDSDRPKRIITSMIFSKECFNLNGEIEVTLNIDNPNSFTLSNIFLNLEYDSEVFTLVNNSITTSTGLNIGTNIGDDGSLEYEDITLPAGISTITFKVKASNDISNYEINPDTLNPVESTFSYDLTSESEDICLGSSTINANGETDLDYCSYCTKSPTGGTAINSNAGISTLKSQFSNWPENVPNGFLVLESGKKGMVLTRTTPTAIGANNWVKGMIIFDISDDKKCISIYNGSTWNCIQKSCNE
ncbi:hypothetical protein [Chishuiella sp.]|uniref:hypothetical protein n=1 Tax=Chishuiella sp. TaxID=1969467 RepID=UPI0028A745FF|nr:hypothetical protein [Chishuiella sp.]